MKPIELFATPTSRQALQDYADLFTEHYDKKAAQLGLQRWWTIVTTDWTQTANFCVEQDIPQRSIIVAITVAAMRWNLECKERTTARQHLTKEELHEHADTIK